MGNWKKGVELQKDPFGNALGGLSEDLVQPWMKTKAFVLIKDIKTLVEIVDEAIEAKFVVLDLESQGLDNRVYDGKIIHGIVGFALCYDGETGFYVPVRHTSANKNVTHPNNGNLPWDEVATQIQRLLDNCICIYHNSVYDTETLWAENFSVKEDPESFEDTMLEGWLINSNSKELGLKAKTLEYLEWKMIEFKDLFPKGSKVLHLEELHPEEVFVYASSDGICTWHLWNIFKENILLKQQAFIYKMEKMLVAVLRRMTRNKVKIDVEYLKELDKELQAKSEKIQSDLRKLCGNSELNIDSAKQIGEALFDKLSIPNAGKTDTSQWKTDRESLENLDAKFKGQYPALSLLVEYRQLQKLRSTYTINLIENLDRNQEGRFGIKACGAPTGRFAAPGGDPTQGFTGVNCQAIPKVVKNKPNIRKGFIARKGFKIVAIDFSGVELRIAGNVANEKKWIDEFNHADCISKYSNDYEIVDLHPLWKKCPYCLKEMGDVHSQTSMSVFGSAEKLYRDKSKGVNFGILYGAGGKTIAENVHVPEDEGYRIVKAFLDSLPNLKRWIKDQHQHAAKYQMIKTAFGRIRLIPEMLSEIKTVVSFGERTAVNSAIQGCLHPDSKVYTKKGRKSLQDLYQEQLKGNDTFKIWTGRSWEDARILVSGLKDLIVTTFEDGRTIKTSPEHLFRVWTPKGFEWVSQDTLNTDMWVAVNSKSIEFDKTPNYSYCSEVVSQTSHKYTKGMTPHNKKKFEFEGNNQFLWEMLGMIYGDGSIWENRLTFHIGSMPLDLKYYDGPTFTAYEYALDVASKIKEPLGLDTSILGGDRTEEGKQPIYRVTIHNKDFRDFCKEQLGVGTQNTYTKRFCPTIFQESFENRCALLRGYFSTDGTISLCNQISLDSVNYELAKDAFDLLCSVGIRSNLKSYNGVHYVKVLDREAFSKYIGFYHLSHKNHRIQNMKMNPRSNQNWGLPKDLIKQIGEIIYKSSIYSGLSNKGEKQVILQFKKGVGSKPTCLKYLNLVPELEIPQFIKDSLEYNYLRPKTFTSNGNIEMLDVEVFDEDHAFVCEDIVVHNTSADITKLAMIACDKYIIKMGWQDVCKMLLTVHDEIVFEIKDDMIEIILPALGRILCRCGIKSWKIPLTVDIEYGNSWGEVDTLWVPTPPKLKCLRENVKPLHVGDLFFDGSVLLDDGSKGDRVEIVETIDPKPEPVKESIVVSVKESIVVSVKETLLETLKEEGTRSIETLISPTSTEFQYIVKRPYTKNKWRKMEALFILAGTGSTKLKLINETGQDLLGSRVILIDPLYFQYKASEWGI